MNENQGSNRDDRLGGLALIAGAVAGIVTMALHPTGRDLAAPGHFAVMAHLAVLAHAIAVAGLPLSFLGALALSRRVETPARLGTAALVVYSVGLVAVLAAATVSGFVAPVLAREMLDAAPPAREAWHLVADYNFYLNQAFARVFVVACSTAIVLWSAAIADPHTRARPLRGRPALPAG